MARDAELDRLKAAQDLAFQRKQDAYQAMQRAWNRRSSARDTLNRAREAKQQAYAAQEASWQDYQRVRASNGPRIDTLNSQQETAYQNMKSAFEQASNAYARRDGAAARAHADDGHGYKAESQGYVAERRRLVQEIRNARERHEATKPDFQRAKAEFNRAKEDNERAKQAFHTRLEKVRAERKRKKDDKRAVAERAGVPHQYLDDVWVAKQADGIINIYFGGVGKPNGLGHGHYVMDQYDRVIYRRDPFDPHGAQNFEDEASFIRRQREQGHRGGFGLPVHGWIDGHSITAAFGWGTREGETLLADGHVDLATFKQHGNHNHYGSGSGPHDNVKDRFQYSGPGA